MNVEDAVVTKQASMKAWIHAELSARGFTRSHSFPDYFRACKSIVGEAARKFQANKYRSGESYRVTAAEYVMDFIDPIGGAG